VKSDDNDLATLVSVFFKGVFTIHVMMCFLADPSLAQTIGWIMILPPALAKFDESKKDSCTADKEFLAGHKK